MTVAWSYHLRNAVARWRSTAATVGGIAVVVLVFALLEALAAGIETIGANTGDPRNLLVTRRGATAETTSQVTLEQARTLRYLPGIARDAAGEPLASADLLIVVNLPRTAAGDDANVQLRAVSATGLALRPQVRLVAGRWFRPGQREVVASDRLAARFASLRPGAVFASSGHEFTVVGTFDGGESAFDSEVWLDADEARAAFDRDNYSSVVLRPENSVAREELVRRIETDKRLKLRAQAESEYYASQTTTAVPLKVLGRFLAVTMSVGACFAAMNTMYAAVGARTREIGTLRVLGFGRAGILAGFMVEGTLLALAGGIIGCALSLLAQPAMTAFGVSLGTINFDTFSETILRFSVTPAVAVKSLLFAAALGLAGSFLPAIRAARLPVIGALRAV